MGIKASSLRCLLHQARALFQSSSADTPSSPVYLPSELIFNILSRLPERCVCRLRCVSREWRALISDPAFVAAHKSRTRPLLVVASQTHGHAIGLRLVDLDGNIVRVITHKGWSWHPVPTSHDDVLCVIGHRNGAAVAGVIDLATMKVLASRVKGDAAWGFGRAVPSGAYKMVCFRDHSSYEVSTIGDGAGWRHRKSRYICHTLNNYAATINGVLYFLTTELWKMDNILCFDLESEEWKNNIKGPPTVFSSCYDIHLGELNGALCMAEPKKWRTNHGCTDIWLLTDYDKSIWVKAYTIPVDPFILADSPMYRWMMPLMVLQDSSKLLFCYTGDSIGTVYLRQPVLQIYDPCEGTCTDVTKKLLGEHGHIVGFCSSHLERSASTKIQHPTSSLCFI